MFRMYLTICVRHVTYRRGIAPLGILTVFRCFCSDIVRVLSYRVPPACIYWVFFLFFSFLNEDMTRVYIHRKCGFDARATPVSFLCRPALCGWEQQNAHARGVLDFLLRHATLTCTHITHMAHRFEMTHNYIFSQIYMAY